MSVNYASQWASKNQQTNAYEQLFKNIMGRLDYLQSRQNKYSSSNNSIVEKGSNAELEKIKNNIKAVMNSNIQNLRMLQENTKTNWEEVVQKVSHVQTKLLQIIKEKEEAINFLEYRVISVESSQKNVAEFMRRVAEQDSEKYSGVGILQQRIKQIQHLQTLRQEQEATAHKITQTVLKQYTDSRIKQINQQIAGVHKQVGENKKSKSDNNMEEIDNKMKAFEIEMRENKRKIVGVDESVKKMGSDLEQLKDQIISMQKELEQFSEKQPHSFNQDIKYAGFRTETNIDKTIQNINNQTFKKTLPAELKPAPLGRQTSKSQKVEAYDSDHYEGSHKAHSKKKQETLMDEDSDPFANMGGPGIRGLLRKSKQKQQKYSGNQSPFQNPLENRRGLPRQKRLEQERKKIPSPRGMVGRNLPPVKADTKTHNRVFEKQSSEEQEEEQVYQVDEEGYLVDEDGNYLYDQDGERVQLSQEQMNNLIDS